MTRYHVTSSEEGGLRDAEFDAYLDVLVELGHPTDREQIRETLPDGKVHLRGGRIGVVDSRAKAEEVERRLRERLPYLPWRIVEC